MRRTGHKQRGFFGTTAVWTAGLTLVGCSYTFLIAPPAEWLSQLPDLVVLLVIQPGLMLPFAAFAGGIASAGRLRTTGVVWRALAVALISYGVIAYARPIVTYHTYPGSDEAREELYPLGPDTPGALLLRRRAILASPPDEFSLRTTEPFRTPPNWIIHMVHGTVALALYAIPAAILGLLFGVVSLGLPPPLRRNLRWAVGLVVGLSFFIPLALAGNWVMGDPERPGILAAWAPMIVPVAEVLLLFSFLRTRNQETSVRAGP